MICYFSNKQNPLLLYRIEDGIYFDTSKFDRYAELAGLDLEGRPKARGSG